MQTEQREGLEDIHHNELVLISFGCSKMKLTKLASYRVESKYTQRHGEAYSTLFLKQQLEKVVDCIIIA